MTVRCWSARTPTARSGASPIGAGGEPARGVGPLHSAHFGDRRAGLWPGRADRALAGAATVGADDLRRIAVGRAAADRLCADAVRLRAHPRRPERPLRPPSGAAAVAERNLRQLSAAGVG